MRRDTRSIVKAERAFRCAARVCVSHQSQPERSRETRTHLGDFGIVTVLRPRGGTHAPIGQAAIADANIEITYVAKGALVLE